MIWSFPVSLGMNIKTLFIWNPHQNERLSKNCLEELFKISRVKCAGDKDVQMEMMAHVGCIFDKFERAKCNGECSNS